jgi:hypothetical protein
LVESLTFKAARSAVTFLCVAVLLPASVRVLHAAGPDHPPADVIGAIEGDSILVQGPMSVESANGQMRTLLRSGSDVQVKSGQAHIDLTEGGNVTICGPAHFSILKSGGALTIALDNGTIHAHIEGSLTLNVYTAQIQAHPLAIAGSAQDVLVGLNSSGAMCFRANKGAVRIEQQLTGQSLLVPQNGDVSLANGQLETLQNSPGHCACELQLAKAAISTQVSGLASTEDAKKKAEDSKPVVPQPVAATAPTEGPIYQVFMPPLHYDAHTKVEQDFDPKLIVLVRRARVRPTLIFQGSVEGDPVVAQAGPPPAVPTVQKSDDPKRAVPDDSTWNRVRSFFHKLWSPTT